MELLNNIINSKKYKIVFLITFILSLVFSIFIASCFPKKYGCEISTYLNSFTTERKLTNLVNDGDAKTVLNATSSNGAVSILKSSGIDEQLSKLLDIRTDEFGIKYTTDESIINVHITSKDKKIVENIQSKILDVLNTNLKNSIDNTSLIQIHESKIDVLPNKLSSVKVIGLEIVLMEIFVLFFMYIKAENSNLIYNSKELLSFNDNNELPTEIDLNQEFLEDSLLIDFCKMVASRNNKFFTLVDMSDARQNLIFNKFLEAALINDKKVLVINCNNSTLEYDGLKIDTNVLNGVQFENIDGVYYLPDNIEKLFGSKFVLSSNMTDVINFLSDNIDIVLINIDKGVQNPYYNYLNDFTDEIIFICEKNYTKKSAVDAYCKELDKHCLNKIRFFFVK